MSILNLVIKEKQRLLYSLLLKCNAEEMACKQYLPDVIWQSIEKGSKFICSTLRSNVKACLCNKYNRLLGTQHEEQPDNRRNLLDNHRFQQSTVSNEVNSKRVTIIGNIYLSTKAVNFLSLKPSFSPAQNIDASAQILQQ